MSSSPRSDALERVVHAGLGDSWALLLLLALLLVALLATTLLGWQYARRRAAERVRRRDAATPGSDVSQPPPRPPRAAALDGSAENRRRAAADGEASALEQGEPAPSLEATDTKAEVVGSQLVAGRTRYPLVLVHGVMGFDRVAFGPLRGEYFRGVKSELRARGFEVHVVRVDPLAPIRVRAAQLARQLGELQAPRVNLVAHSMGGLDARFAIAHLGLAFKVASLTTIGTPHHGTPIADHGTRWLGEGLGLRRLASALGAETGAFWDLTTGHMQRFNAQVPDAKEVFYASVLSAGGRVHPLLRATHGWLARRHGPSDGLVPVESQRWGTVISEVEADHWAQVGWGGGFDAPAFYAQIADSLRKRNL